MISTPQYLYAHDDAGHEVVMLNSGQTIADAVREVWVEDVYQVNGADLSGVVVDVGAHQGAFTLRALAQGATRVVAVEPDPANVQVFIENMRLNGIGDQVSIIEAAVAASPGRGRATLMDGTDMVTVEHDPAGLINLVTLADIIDQARAGETVRLAKLDIEGGEFEAVTRFSNLAYAQQIAMETHASTGGALGRMIEILLDTHNVTAFGHPPVGGMLHGTRY